MNDYTPEDIPPGTPEPIHIPHCPDTVGDLVQDTLTGFVTCVGHGGLPETGGDVGPLIVALFIIGAVIVMGIGFMVVDRWRATRD